MVEVDVIYRKTANGVDAIATRQPALTARQRSLLILVDGQRSFHQLATLGSALGNTHDTLALLLGLGLIEPTGRRGPQPVPTRAQPAEPPAAARSAGATQLLVPLQHAQDFATERLLDLLGPEGDDLCHRLRATRSPQEFRAALRRTETSLREVVGPELAEQFLREVENLRGP